MEKEKIAEKFPLWTVLLVIILPFITAGASWFYTSAGAHLMDMGGKLAYVMVFPAAPLFAAFILMMLTRMMGEKFRVSNRTLAYLYAAITAGLIYGNLRSPHHSFQRLMGGRYIDGYGLSAKYVPSWWIPSKEVIAAFLQPGSLSSAWIPVIIYWWIYGSAIFFLVLGLSIFVRHQWYDVENLTYPYAQTAIESFRSIQNPDRPQTKKFLIGTVVGFLVFLPYMLRQFFAWIPDIYGWYNSQTHWTAYVALRVRLVMPTVYKSVVGLTFISYNPLYVAISLFMPLNTLLSATVFYLGYVIIGTQISYYLGYYTGIETVSGGSRANLLRHQAPINLTGFTEHGILPATLIFAVLLNWRALIATPLRLALGTGSKSEKAQESEEAVSYRTALIMIVVSAVVILACLIVSGFTADLAIIFLFVSIMLYQLSYGRARGYAGPLPMGDRVAPLFFRWKYPNVTIDNVPGPFFLYGIHGHMLTDLMANWASTSLPIFDSWRVGLDMGADKKTLFKVLTVAGILAPLFGILGFLLVGQTIGMQNTNRPGFWDQTGFGTPMYVYTRPSPPHVWPHILAGFITAGVLSYLRYRFYWWPIDPIGAYIATGGPGVKIGLGWVFVIAFVIKYIILKIGGSKLYNESAAPFAAGFITGNILTSVIGLIIGISVFFRPI